MAVQRLRQLRQLARPLTALTSVNLALDVRRLKRTIGSLGWFTRDFLEFRRRSTRRSLTPRFRDVVPIVLDRTAPAGSVRSEYFHQDLWAARRIFERRPSTHLDVGSRIDGFIAHLLVFMEVRVIDVRELESTVPGLVFERGDASELAGIPDDSVESISCLHAAEHFGLGRYGDPIDPEGCFRAMHALARVLAPGGRLYFSVPIGRERVHFNAHRVLSPLTVLTEMSALELVAFAVIDGGRLLADVDPRAYVDDDDGCCGLFEFTKPAIRRHPQDA